MTLHKQCSKPKLVGKSIPAKKMTPRYGTPTMTSSSSVADALVLTPKHKNTTHGSSQRKAVRFYQGSPPEEAMDKSLQSKVHRRRFLRRGSRSPIMLAIQAARSSAEYAQELQWQDDVCGQPDDGYLTTTSTTTTTNSSNNDLLSDDSLGYNHTHHHHKSTWSSPVGIRRAVQWHVSALAAPSPRTATRHMVNHELAQSLFHKTQLTPAQKRRLSLEILSRVSNSL